MYVKAQNRKVEQIEQAMRDGRNVWVWIRGAWETRPYLAAMLMVRLNNSRIAIEKNSI